MASELKPSGYFAMPEAAETYEPAAWVRDRNLIKEPVKKAGLLEQLEQAASEIAELLASSLGPKGMNKLIINPVNETFLTSDGKVILKELDIPHPIVTSFKKLAESMDKGCGDGTKTAVLLASNLIINAIELRKQGVQPTTLLRGYELALRKAYELLGYSVKQAGREEMRIAVFCSALSKGVEKQQAEAITTAVLKVMAHLEKTRGECFDLNKHVKLLKKRGGPEILGHEGIVLDENPARVDMPMEVENPLVLLLNYDLKLKSEYLNPRHNPRLDCANTGFLFEERKKESCKEIAAKILATGAKVLFCEGDIDPLIEAYLKKNKLLAFKKLKLKDLEKVSQVTGASITAYKEELKPRDLGKAERIWREKKNGENFVFIAVKKSKISTILIREPSNYGLDKIEEAADDALNNAAFLLKTREVVNGGGAIEFELAYMLKIFASTLRGKEQLAVLAYAEALQKIPEALACNAGMNPLDAMVQMNSAYSQGKEARIGMDRKITACEPAVYDAASIKKLAIVSASELVGKLLRIDEIVPKN